MQRDDAPGGGVFTVIMVVGWIAFGLAVLAGFLIASGGIPEIGIPVALSGAFGGLLLVGLARIGIGVQRTAWASEAMLEIARRGAAAQAGVIPPEGRVVAHHKGAGIKETPAGFEVEGRAFPSVEAAKRYLDRPTA